MWQRCMKQVPNDYDYEIRIYESLCRSGRTKAAFVCYKQKQKQKLLQSFRENELFCILGDGINYYIFPTPSPLVMKPCTRFNLVQTNLKINPVENNSLAKQFRIRLDSERFGTVDYEKLNGSSYDLVHAAIPEEYQGLGLGRILAERIFDHITNNNKKIKLTCEFLQKFYGENRAKYSAHVINDNTN